MIEQGVADIRTDTDRINAESFSSVFLLPRVICSKAVTVCDQRLAAKRDHPAGRSVDLNKIREAKSPSEETDACWMLKATLANAHDYLREIQDAIKE